MLSNGLDVPNRGKNDMKRTFAFLLTILGIAIPALGAKRVTVAECQQALAELHAKPDADAAWQIANLQLTERMSAAALAHAQGDLPGEKSKQALQALADEAAFLNPPAAELPADSAPDFAEQRRMMGLVVAYVKNTIPQLPNFFATRDTVRYEDTPLLQTPDSLEPYQPLHVIDRAEATVLYQDGREIVDPGAQKNEPATVGLTTWGVFGPILGTVLVDAAQSKLAWSHWEQGSRGRVGVFSYAVPKEKSHYEVNFCCVANESATVVANVHRFRQLVGYHGEMTIDPATGAITRLVVQADLKTTDPVVRASVLVEYGPVEIGGKTYICPVRSVSDTLAQTVQVDERYKFPLANQLQPLKISLNDVAYAQYHMFRSEAHIVARNPGDLAAHSAGDRTGEPSGNSAPDATAPASANGADTNAASSGSPSNGVSAPTAASASAPVAAAPSAGFASTSGAADSRAPAAVIPEISMAPATRFPDAPAHPASEAGTGFTLRTTSRLVDVTLVAYDKKGRPITDLKPGDLEVDDNGRKQEIRFFSQAGAREAPAAQGDHEQPAASPDPSVFSNEMPGTTAQEQREAEGDTTILMIDSGNVAFSDLTYARSETLRFMKTLAADERIGIYILKSHGFEILLEPTTDHAQAASILAHWMPSAQDLARAQDEEQRNRQQFDWVHNVTDLANVNGNGQGGNDPEMYTSGKAVASAAAYPSDAELRPLGNRPEDFVLHLLVGVGRHLASIPGHKMLVWISSDNVLADFSAQTVGREDTGNRFLDKDSLRAREALNDAHVSIYPLDVSQLEVSVAGADIGTRNVLAIGKSDRDRAMTAVGDNAPVNSNGRDTARMQEDTHPIQGAFRELAAATGGRALRRDGDIAAELNNVVADGRAAYLLSFTPDQPADDQYHVLTVKLTGRRDISLRYRTGYLYSKEAENLKDRFRQTIWQPREAEQIKVAAIPVHDANGAALRLNIGATDLEWVQQGDRWTDHLDVFLALRDDAGLNATVRGNSLHLRMTAGNYQKLLHDGIPFEQPIDLKVNFDSVRIVVLDENSGRMGSVTVPGVALRRAP
jgi:VWFA-related protein